MARTRYRLIILRIDRRRSEPVQRGVWRLVAQRVIAELVLLGLARMLGIE